ncbi:hypothetical protein BHE74_00022794 [Ensete ventricosum]|nr:hypothetical protein BHE74_00022794 [Ensete ventricosum]
MEVGDRGEEMEGSDCGVQVSTHHHQRFLRAEEVLPELAPPLRAGLLLPDPGASGSPSSKLDHSVVVSDSTMQTPKARKRALTEPLSKGPYDFTVTGSIDGKFEYGYMVTVKIGAETLRGVLYRVQQEQPSAASSSSLVAAAAAAGTSHAADVAAVTRTRRRRRRGWRRRDPTHPKPNRSAYNFFFAETHSKLKALHPHREREFSKMIGESWSKLSEEERMVCRSSSLMASYVYQDYGLKDKERYKREMQEYKERLKLAQPKEVVVARAEPSSEVVTEEVKESADGQ